MNVNEAIQSAFENYRAGNLQQAEQVLIKVLEEQPHNLNILYFLGIIYGQLGKLNEAINSFQKAIQINPNFDEARNNLANILQEKRQFDEVRKPKIKKRVALLNDTLHWYHWGCTGTSSALHQTISNLDYEIFSLPIIKIYNCNNSPQKIQDFDDPTFFTKFSLSNPTVMKIINNVDIVVVNGEGSIHGLRQNVLNLLYLSYLSKIILGKSVQIINHSCYPESAITYSKTLAWEIYEKVYRVLDFIAIREPVSFNLMKNAGIPVTLSFDCLPLYITNNYHKKVNRRTNNIVITSSMGRGINLNILCSYIAFLKHLGYEIQFLTGASAFPAQDDMIFIEKLSQICSDNWNLITAKTIDEWLDIINTAKLLISGRFHHTIAAAVLGTPYILLESNTPKNMGLAKILNAETPLSYADADFLTQLINRTNFCLNNTEYKKDEHNSLIFSLCELAKKNFMILEKMAV
jgi:polysaccharide pyruvyl transferase WcaK-like protein